MATAAAALIAVQLAVRAVLAFGGYFYWDDLILIGKAGTHNLLAPSYLFDDHDGHVMPGAFLLAGTIIRLAPLDWTWPAVSLLVLQLLASLALLRALHVILGWRPVLLIPLAFALFTPLGVPGFAWWAAALNSLPMLAALAWVCADAILLVRTGKQRYAVTGVLVYLGGLLFFEKAAVIPFVAFAVAALLCHVTGDRSLASALATVWRAGLRLWIAALALTAAWVALYLAVVNQQRWSSDLGMTGQLLLRSITHGIVPGLAGGPWHWDRWAPASPWATPPPPVMALGWLVLAAILAVSLVRKERIGPVWVIAVGYAVACQVPIYLMRSSKQTALELAQTLRYLPDLVVVLALLAAVALCAPNRRTAPRWLDASPKRTAVAAVLAALFVASSLYSTATFLTSWRDNPAQPYLRNARAALAQAHAASGAPLLDQEVDPLVLQRVAAPENLASHLFALLRDRPEFAPATTELRMFDRSGRLIEARVTWVRTIAPGPMPRCGYFAQPDKPARLVLDGPLLPADWTVELNYLANSDGSMTLKMTQGPEVKVPVHPGLNRVFARLPGAGDAITVRANTTALALCIASGPVGFLAPA
ncbi:cell division protein, Z-ring complex Ib [Mycobacterium [tuberculosis] TKK-01-0051]|uniref:Cell division protein, Z-ring complex Ib n=1 Tax=Mycobacterium [tuberculosis] TKK-01-0051 TaxID=1324261 RepID=A0A051TN55_9MYCO|nr:cell division protein, Z-ring complex Ib [Mycobacterium [tuberculosis] TKK-01-0051]